MAAEWIDRFRRRSAALVEIERARRLEPPVAFVDALALQESLWAEARLLGAFDGTDPLTGIDVDVALVKAIRNVRAPA